MPCLEAPGDIIFSLFYANDVGFYCIGYG